MRSLLTRLPRLAAVAVATVLVISGVTVTTSAWAAPVTSATPTISGTAQVGQTLTASAGSWTPGDTTFSYQWKRGATNIGTDSATYTVVADDVGSTITVTVTGSADGYESASETSAATSTVIAGVFSTAPTPTISGTAKVGHTLTASAGTWVPTPTDVTYQWKRNGSDISSATSSTYVLATADLGAAISVTTTATKSGFTSQSRSSTATVAISAGAYTASPRPTLSGTLQVGRTLTATLGSWTPTPTTVRYQWYRGDNKIAGATSSTYTLRFRDRGRHVWVRIVASNSGIAAVVRRSDRSLIASGVFQTTPTPTIAGTTEVGDTLTATVGSWSDSANLTYQWKRAGTAISGATGTTYVIQPADFGSTITFAVTGKRRGFTTATVTSAATSAATATELTATSVPTITSSGTYSVGQRLTAVPGSWGPGTVTFTYQWMNEGVDIEGATSSTYVVTATDLGDNLSVEVTGSKFGYVSESETSLETSTIGVGTFSPAPTPVISGTVRVGKTLTATLGTWDSGATTKVYQWTRDGEDIADATGLTYELTADDLGAEIAFEVTASASGYTTASRTSLTTNPVVIGVFSSTPTPLLVGTGRVGTTLSVTTGNWGSTPDDFDYQWYKNGVAIVGATSSTYSLSASHVNASISVAVTANRDGFVSVTRTSADTVVRSGLFDNTVAPSISGILSLGQTLTASTGTWSPSPDHYDYQWKRGGVAIVGANQSTYTVNATDVGKSITVTVTANANGYADKSVTSTAVTIG